MSANLMSLARSGGKFLKLYGDRKMLRPLPYDAEVEWIKARREDIAFLDTGILADSDTRVEFGFSVDLADIDSKIAGIFGTVDYYRGGISTIGGMFRDFSPSLEVVAGKVYDYSMAGNVGSISGSSLNHGEGKAIYTMRFGSFLERGPGGQTAQIYRNSVTIYYVRIFRALDLVLDLVPARFTNERGETEGAMYDRVSDQLFRNAGTGAFVIGPDKTT